MSQTTKREAAVERLVRFFTVMAWIGLVVLILGTALGMLTQGSARFATIGAAVAAGLVLTWVGLRERRRGKRILQEKDRSGAVALRGGRNLDPAGLARRWRNVAIGNSVAGVVSSALATAFLPTGFAVGVVAVLALAVADTWYLERRFEKLGRLTR